VRPVSTIHWENELGGGRGGWAETKSRTEGKEGSKEGVTLGTGGASGELTMARTEELPCPVSKWIDRGMKMAVVPPRVLVAVASS
jgi:hypothetical protein